MAALATTMAAYGDRFGPNGHGHRPLRILVFVLFLALLGTVIWLVVREVKRRRTPALAGAAASGAGPVDTALEQVRMRYARSEITRDEYVQMTEDLGGSPPA